ncbi:hypothetical protein [Streptomyces microflavus]
MATAITKLLYEDFVGYGTDGKGMRLNDESVVPVIKAHGTILERLALARPQWPFKTFDGSHSFGSYWRKNGMSGGGGWQARRECVESILGPAWTPWTNCRSSSTRAASRTGWQAASRS